MLESLEHANLKRMAVEKPEFYYDPASEFTQQELDFVVGDIKRQLGEPPQINLGNRNVMESLLFLKNLQPALFASIVSDKKQVFLDFFKNAFNTDIPEVEYVRMEDTVKEIFPEIKENLLPQEFYDKILQNSKKSKTADSYFYTLSIAKRAGMPVDPDIDKLIEARNEVKNRLSKMTFADEMLIMERMSDVRIVKPDFDFGLTQDDYQKLVTAFKDNKQGGVSLLVIREARMLKEILPTKLDEPSSIPEQKQF